MISTINIIIHYTMGGILNQKCYHQVHIQPEYLNQPDGNLQESHENVHQNPIMRPKLHIQNNLPHHEAGPPEYLVTGPTGIQARIEENIGNIVFQVGFVSRPETELSNNQQSDEQLREAEIHLSQSIENHEEVIGNETNLNFLIGVSQLVDPVPKDYEVSIEFQSFE